MKLKLCTWVTCHAFCLEKKSDNSGNPEDISSYIRLGLYIAENVSAFL